MKMYAIVKQAFFFYLICDNRNAGLVEMIFICMSFLLIFYIYFFLQPSKLSNTKIRYGTNVKNRGFFMICNSCHINMQELYYIIEYCTCTYKNHLVTMLPVKFPTHV